MTERIVAAESGSVMRLATAHLETEADQEPALSDRWLWIRKELSAQPIHGDRANAATI